MGWDYYTFLAQPTWFVEQIKDMMFIELKKKQNGNR
jgi:hypothetical protein